MATIQERLRAGWMDVPVPGAPFFVNRVPVPINEEAATHIDALEKRVEELEAERDEARAKAIEECAVIAERHTGMNVSGNMEYGPNMPKLIAFDIRALNGGAKP